MKKNIGRNDKVARIILGLLIIVLGIVYSSWWGLIAIIPLATAFMNFCPLYKPFGISTCKKKID